VTFDDELHRALRREQPSDGFADGVIARLGRPVVPVEVRRWRPSRLTAVAATVLLTALAGWFYTERQQEREIQRVRRDVEVALRITSEKLSEVQSKLVAFSSKRGADHAR
jgi:hypothetical protein